MNIPLIEQIKIQAQVLVPLVKTLQAELGEGEANRLVRKALGELYREFGRSGGGARSRRTLGRKWRRHLMASRQETPWITRYSRKPRKRSK